MQFSTGIFQIGVVGTDIHQRCDGFAAPDYGHILKQLSGLIEQHDRDRFRVFADGKCADGRDRHQKVLVEDFAVQDVADCPEKDVGTDDEIGCRAQGDVQGRRRPGGAEKQCARCNAHYGVFLSFVHMIADCVSVGKDRRAGVQPGCKCHSCRFALHDAQSPLSR